MKRVAVVDFGMGNLHSVRKALSLAAKDEAEITEVNDAGDIETADKVVFPGQGRHLIA